MGSISGGRGQGELEAPVWGCRRLWDETQGVRGEGGRDSGRKEKDGMEGEWRGVV